MDDAPLQVPGLSDLALIGEGGFATVYRARQEAFGRDVAVKVLRARISDPDAVSRFERECMAMGSVAGHPHIVTVHGSGRTADGRLYLVMSHERRGSLADRLEAEARLPWQEVVAIGVALSGALESAHRAGVLHRDVKPENVLVSAFNEVKLSDFGIARVTGGTETTSGMVTASIVHAAPEVLDGRRASAVADVYSLGSTLCTLLGGRPPFANPADESIAPLVARIATAPLPDYRALGVPDDLQRVLEWACAKDPGQRAPGAAALGRALEGVAAGAGLAVRPMLLEEHPDTPLPPVAPDPSTLHGTPPPLARAGPPPAWSASAPHPGPAATPQPAWAPRPGAAHADALGADPAPGRTSRTTVVAAVLATVLVLGGGAAVLVAQGVFRPDAAPVPSASQATARAAAGPATGSPTAGPATGAPSGGPATAPPTVVPGGPAATGGAYGADEAALSGALLVAADLPGDGWGPAAFPTSGLESYALCGVPAPLDSATATANNGLNRNSELLANLVFSSATAYPDAAAAAAAWQSLNVAAGSCDSYGANGGEVVVDEVAPAPVGDQGLRMMVQASTTGLTLPSTIVVAQLGPYLVTVEAAATEFDAPTVEALAATMLARL